METGKRLERRRLFSEGWVFCWFCGYGLDWGTLFIYATVGPGPGVYLLGLFLCFSLLFLASSNALWWGMCDIIDNSMEYGVRSRLVRS